MFGALSLSRFRGRLLAILLAMSLVPIVGTGWAFFHFLTSNATTATYQRLDLMRNAKRDELQQYLTFARWQAENFRKSNSVRYAVGQYYGFSYGFRLIDPSADRSQKTLRDMFGIDTRYPVDAASYLEMLRVAPEYANAHRQFHNEFADFIANSEFSNVYLVNADQRVVYSVRKDSYLGVDLRTQMATSQLADAVRVVLADPNASATYVSDFIADPVTGEFSALVATRIDIYRKNRGVAVYRLSTDKLDAIVQAQGSNLGQVYLLSQGNLVISAPTGGPLHEGRPVGLSHDAFASGVVQEGLGGGPTLSARTDVTFENLSWPLIAEIPTSIAFAGSEFIRNLVIMLSLVLVPIMIVAAVLLSGSMTRPLRVLTDEAAAIADGDLDRIVADIRSPSELARLAASFRRMRDAIREQLQLIGEKNRQLESQIAVIAEKNLALEEADRLKDTFVANTSHELRTPLNGIIGIAETLTAGAAGALSTQQRNQLQLIVFSARRLSRLVDDLLDLYRIRENRIRLDIQAVDVPSSINNVLRLAEPLLRGAPITLAASVPDDLPAVEVDPLRFEQILYNLLGNAVKFTEAGAITITASVHSDETIEIVVSDTGRGIQLEDVERIFKPLERGEAANILDGPSGTGLGLTIAQHLAELMAGGLSVRSEVGAGSQFILTLPRSRSLSERGGNSRQLQQAVSRFNQPEIGHDEPVSEGCPLILVVDDEPINIQVLRNVLQPHGYAVRSVTSGREALQFVDHTVPDLIILDVMMPGMSGLDVARVVRSRFGLLELPVIMVTARSRTRDVLAGFDAGANDYVTKPFVKDELLARVAMLLEARQSLARGLENTSLHAEVDRRTQIEHALRLSQQRMARMLDTLDVAVMCFDAQRRVTYANQPGQSLLRTVSDETPLVALFGTSVAHAIDEALRFEGRIQLDKIDLQQSGQTMLLSAFELEPEEGGGLALIITPSTTSYAREPGQLISTVQGVIDSFKLDNLAPTTFAGNGEALSTPEADDYRVAIVEVVSKSLLLWKEVTGTGKIDLAEQSGIWRVNLDRSSLQVRTLDKYLLTDSLPQNPRWRDVLKTAEFVLEYVTTQPDYLPPKPSAEALEMSLARLRVILRSRVADGS